MISVIRPQLCSFLILVFIFQLQVLDQNKAKTKEYHLQLNNTSWELKSFCVHLPVELKNWLLGPRRGGSGPRNGRITWQQAGWLCPTNPTSETGKKSRFIASGGDVAGEAGGGRQGKASSGLRRYAGRRTSSWHPLFRMNNQLLTLHGSGGCIVWHQFLIAAGKKGRKSVPFFWWRDWLFCFVTNMSITSSALWSNLKSYIHLISNSLCKSSRVFLLFKRDYKGP